MAIHLKDIIDLDFLLNLDEQRESEEEREKIAARDRDIFIHLDPPPKTDHSLLFSWLEFRKLLFIHETDRQARLPGTLFASLYWWLKWLLLGTGFFSGLSIAYSFLAYHGTRPVNVTLFFALFILLPVVLLGITLISLLIRWLRSDIRPFTLVRSLVSWFFRKGAALSATRRAWISNGKEKDPMGYTDTLLHMRNQEYFPILFWPFFLLSSYFAVAFSAGAFGGTLFRVAVHDMAFGWQSTLVTSSDRIHTALQFISFPWSWIVPETLAHPTLDQIEGTRLLLKEGISSLATPHLVSWWPFLCLGILFYGVLPRLLLILAGTLVQYFALARFDFERPRFHRLKVRMKSPVMDIQFNEKAVQTARGQTSLADPWVPGKEESSPKESHPQRRNASLPRKSRALLLSSSSIHVDGVLSLATQAIGRQLYFDVDKTAGISFDLEADQERLASLSRESFDQVVVLQEVWQPPIRGLLHYYVQLKTRVFTDQPLWIFLIQAPGEEGLTVDKEEIDFLVWKKAASELGHPEILVERMVK